MTHGTHGTGPPHDPALGNFEHQILVKFKTGIFSF